MPLEAYRVAKVTSADQKPGPIPFFATGISSVSSCSIFSFFIKV